ncbi:hypothetical protein AQJ46_43685 [Streptomyces canus]|uniref:Uncharacterized protein n=1 Tax=Streptomyces canus TaxID=58343 RepID=A0A101RMG7_9ACTN|nr:hypothetical protein AQJ46_43685 [Streptomyces canus]
MPGFERVISATMSSKTPADCSTPIIAKMTTASRMSGNIPLTPDTRKPVGLPSVTDRTSFTDIRPAASATSVPATSPIRAVRKDHA